MQPCDTNCRWHPNNYIGSISKDDIYLDKHGVKHLKNKDHNCIFTEKPIVCRIKCKFYEKKLENKFGY